MGPNGWPMANWMSPLSSAGIAFAPPWAGTTSIVETVVFEDPLVDRAPQGAGLGDGKRGDPDTGEFACIFGVGGSSRVGLPESVQPLRAMIAAAAMVMAARLFFIDKPFWTLWAGCHRGGAKRELVGDSCEDPVGTALCLTVPSLGSADRMSRFS